jgi:serine/threonine protein kinase
LADSHRPVIARAAVTLSTGTKVGPYEIVSTLGVGGMGEVYRAFDERLGREVAIKVVPTAYADDQDRLRRFEQEARAASALNHPNILSIFDVGQHNGTPYVVSELLEGETLHKRIDGTPLSQRRAIRYALQIAHGLAAAHAKGIIHRDLKPDNIFITTDERVKILDFGLAKLTQPDFTQTQSNIVTRRVETDPGSVMGTVSYMSPEQLKGEDVDQRSDIFSLGAVLYEMLAGQSPFYRESVAETMSAILKEDPPDLSHTNKTVSQDFERLINHCLEKNPELRFYSASDLAFALDAIPTSANTAAMSAQTVATSELRPPRITRRQMIFGAVAAIAVIAAIALAVVLALSYSRQAPTEVHTVRFFINPPEKASFGPFAISPDGQHLAFVASDASGKASLWVRPLDSPIAQPLSGTEDAIYPFWSPDSRFIGFFAGGKLKKIELSGGTVQTLCSAAIPRGGSWSSSGVIVFGPSPNEPLYQVKETGGPASPLTKLEPSRQEASHRWPFFLPDGRHFLYSVLGGPQSQGIYVTSLDGKDTRRLLNISSSIAMYAAPGYLLFRHDATLMGQVFDLNKLQLSGDAFPVAEQVGFDLSTFQTYFSVSQTGVLTYSAATGGKTQLTWVDRGGKELGLIGQPANYIRPSLSPDGKRVAVDGSDSQGNRDVWLLDLASGNSTRFTFDPAQDLFAVWSPDGSRIVFGSDREGPRNLYQRSAKGAGKEERLLKSDFNAYPVDWSHDGKYIAYVINDPKTKIDVWVLPLFGDQKPFPFANTQASERGARFSPDGKWLAYVSDESGVPQIYVETFPSSGGKWQVSSSGGYHLAWRHDGKELFYVAADRKMMAVDIKGEGASFEAGPPKPLFELRVPTFTGSQAQFAVTPDGQKFLIANTHGENKSEPITVALNWTANLKQ